MLKKFVLFITLVLISSMFLHTGYAKEQTLDELYAQVKANREAYEKAKNEKQLTENERNEATAQKKQVENEISNIEKQVKDIGNQIDGIKKDIDKKNKQMKEIMSFVQVSEGSNNYLEYVFGAKDFTDFIYRVSVAEQLGDYNEQLVKEYEDDVKKLDDKQKELNDQQNLLHNKQSELSLLEAKLNKQIETIQEGMLTKDEEYRTEMNTINNMKKLGCRGSDTLTACKNRIASQVKPTSPGRPNNSGSGAPVRPSSNGVYYPIARGYMTSDYGQRTGEFHTGMDWSSGSVDPVYSVADGRVINIDYGNAGTCGNNRVYILHNIGGVQYTTSYWHLVSVNVSVGQDVTANTQIGKMGGRGYKDPCASGGHVHLNLFRGYTTTNSGRINPKIIVPSPGEWNYFSGR